MMDFIRNIIANLRREEGQALAEYTLVLAFIAIACILALTALGLAIATFFDDFTAMLP